MGDRQSQSGPWPEERPESAAGARPVDNAAPASTPPAGVVLVITDNSARKHALTKAMRRDDMSYACADSLEAGLGLVRSADRGNSARYSACVLDCRKCSSSIIKVVRELGSRRIATVVVCPEMTFDDALRALRAGAVDVVPAGIKPSELARRVRAAAATWPGLAPGSLAHLGEAPTIPVVPEQDMDSASPSNASEHGGTPGVSAPLGKAKRLEAGPRSPQELAEQFAVVIRHELDVESLLRQVLEFVLAHAGATNAAVFLPGSGGDFSLGAYVNYTCPKDAAEVLLDHLANVAAPRLENAAGVLLLKDRGAIIERFGESVEWMHDCHVIAFACRHQHETLAVFTLFREAHQPFPDHLIPLLGRVSECFGAQLARVIRIHHRHLPRDKWGALGDPMDDPDTGGMAA